MLIIHTHYQQKGGEDNVFQKEAELCSEISKVEVICFNNNNGLPGAVQFFFSLWNVFAARKLERKILEFKPDVIHIHNLHFAIGPFVIIAAKRYGIPIVFTLHNYRLLCPSATLLHNKKIFTDSISNNFPWNAICQRVYRNSYLQTFWLAFIYWFHKKVGTWQLVDKYIALTMFSKELLLQSHLQLSPEKIVVKPNFVKLPPIKKVDRTNSFLFVGRLSEEKGIEVLLQAFSLSPFLLCIAGEGSLKEKVKDVAGQQSNIKYLGRLNENQIQTELGKCSALIFPSIWYEGMPMTILEAFATGTPVIASKLGAMETMIKDGINGLHFEPGNAADLRSKLEIWQALSDNDKDEFRRNAHISYESLYTPEKNKEQLISIYHSLIKDKNDYSRKGYNEMLLK